MRTCFDASITYMFFYWTHFTICNMYLDYIYMYIANNMCGAFPLDCMMECLVQTYSTRWIQMMPSRLWVHWMIYCKTSKYWCTKKNWARPKGHVLEHNRIQYGHCATFPIWQFWGGCKYVRKMWRFHSPTTGCFPKKRILSYLQNNQRKHLKISELGVCFSFVMLQPWRLRVVGF